MVSYGFPKDTLKQKQYTYMVVHIHICAIYIYTYIYIHTYIYIGYLYVNIHLLVVYMHGLQHTPLTFQDLEYIVVPHIIKSYLEGDQEV